MFAVAQSKRPFWFDQIVYDYYRDYVMSDYETNIYVATSSKGISVRSVLDLDDFILEFEYYFGGATSDELQLDEWCEQFGEDFAETFNVHDEYIRLIFEDYRLTTTNRFPQKEVW